MPNVTIDPNMGFGIPVVSEDPGPDWATQVNAALTIIGQHDHSPGKGVPISQSGIALVPTGTAFDSLNFNASNAFGLRSVRFTPQSAALALITDVGCLYEAGVDLYFNDGSGNQIRITQGGSVAGSSGTITGLPSGTASAAFSGSTFIWESATATAANMDFASAILRNNTPSSKGLTLQPPNAMAADYSLTLPTVPGATQLLQIDNAGNITAGATATNPNFPGKALQEDNLNVVVSNTNATNSLSVIRGVVASNATITSGEGFSVSSSGTGKYAITFSTAFGDVPAVTATRLGNIGSPSAFYASLSILTNSSFNVGIFDSSGTLTNSPFTFIAIGQRA